MSDEELLALFTGYGYHVLFVEGDDLDAAIYGAMDQAYGEIRATLEKQGRLIGNNDLWIAAHALSLNVTLATNNVREFRRVAGLSVENWIQ